jgi:zinc transport system substrate-binding protein
MSRLLALASTTAILAGAASAEAPKVVVDIAPVHSLVARVMEGVGVPSLIVTPGASPHQYQMRPSQAAALQDADIVVWMSESLTPWLEETVETLSGDAAHLALLETEGTTLYAFREMAVFGDHGHGDKHDDHGHAEKHDDHGHAEKHDDHDHAEKHDDHGHAEKHDDHAGHGHDDHGHSHDGADAHAWLSTENAAHWIGAIADTLAARDPENAATYAANAEAARAELAALKSEISATLEPVRGERFVVFHDAYQYFEMEFGLNAAGAISMSDAARPSPARIAEVQEEVAEANVRCVLSEPQFNPDLVATVMDGTPARTAVADPQGLGLEPGAALYPQLMRNLAGALATCLTPEG